MTEDTQHHVKIPDLLFESPPCPIYGCPSWTDENGDGYRCDECGVQWDSEGADGVLDEDVPRCGAVGEYVTRHHVDGEIVVRYNAVCWLPAGHGETGRLSHAGYDPNDPVTTWRGWHSEARG